MNHTTGISETEFEIVTMIGGPHDGQTMLVYTAEDDKLTLKSDGKAHVYHRLSNRPRFYHTTRLASLLGGGR